MGRFRKKPLVIEATQWHGPEKDQGPHDLGVDRMAAPCGQGWLTIDPHGDEKSIESGRPAPANTVDPGDWIIIEADGRRWPCKPDIFAETYEPVNCPLNPNPEETSTAKE